MSRIQLPAVKSKDRPWNNGRVVGVELEDTLSIAEKIDS
ncbi:hypothetical protein PFRI_38030 [Planktotalea frisia]|jgi:hypothetical protein|uniref:Uncharacterized protein n=1 Tax=Planktotalea frisia TaxID=696762 RepID=A0A1L9NS28_9RHOB|nr:hypothetical protein PFRI_38030 [Planktotalea frisia]